MWRRSELLKSRELQRGQTSWEPKRWCMNKWYNKRMRCVDPGVGGVAPDGPAELPGTITTV